MIKKLLIDIDDTILDFRKCGSWSLFRAAGDMGVTIPEDAFQTFLVINTKMWKDLEKNLITKEELYRTRFGFVFEKWGIEGDSVRFGQRYEANLAESTFLIEGAREFLEYLSSKYEIYTASNGLYQSQINRLTKAGLTGYIKDNFISEKVGAQKPSKAFFEHCLKNSGCGSKDEIVMIGDSISADLYGAKEIGIGYYWFNWRREECPEDLHPKGTIYKLKEISNYL